MYRNVHITSGCVQAALGAHTQPGLAIVSRASELRGFGPAKGGDKRRKRSTSFPTSLKETQMELSEKKQKTEKHYKKTTAGGKKNYGETTLDTPSPLTPPKPNQPNPPFRSRRLNGRGSLAKAAADCQGVSLSARKLSLVRYIDPVRFFRGIAFPEPLRTPFLSSSFVSGRSIVRISESGCHGMTLISHPSSDFLFWGT